MPPVSGLSGIKEGYDSRRCRNDNSTLRHNKVDMTLGQVSNINLIGFSFISLMSILTIFLPRRFALIPIFMATCYITIGQQVVVAGLNFTGMRILILCGWLRLVMRREISAIKLNAIDKAIIYWVIASIITYTLLWQTSGAFINRLGLAYNALGLYFLFRYIIRDFDDINRTMKMLAIVIVPLAVAMLIENATGRNLFSIFGGVPEVTWVRDGRLRCQGPFRSPILAGTFGATLIPFFVALWFDERNLKKLSIIGIISATVITVTSASSGPVMAYLFAITALAMWPFRKRMRVIRWGILLSLLSFHLIMKAPVWYLIARLGHLIGGTGWHRAYLIDQAVKHFNEWWLLGTKVTAHWMPYTLPNSDKADITNQFIVEGVNGGLVTMLLFIAIIVYCFKGLGRALRAIEDQSFAARITVWSMGAALFAHTMTFFSVSYFDQIIVIWYLLLAMIATISSMPKTVKNVWSGKII